MGRFCEVELAVLSVYVSNFVVLILLTVLDCTSTSAVVSVVNFKVVFSVKGKVVGVSVTVSTESRRATGAQTWKKEKARILTADSFHFYLY